MSTSPTLTLPLVESRIDPTLWAERVAAADVEATVLARVLARVHASETRLAAIAAEVPEQPHRTVLTRLRRFEQGGRDALIDRRAPKARERKLTVELLGGLRALANEHPTWGSHALAAALEATLGVPISSSTVRVALSELGLSRSRGRPQGGVSRPVGLAEEERTVTPLPLAGAELLKALEEHVGAVRHLTLALGQYLENLPEPEGPVLDDREHRDERGRFLPEYNEPKSRTDRDLGGKFDTSERRRREKDLREMRVANSSFAARYSKDLSLTLLPVVVDAPRWSVLAHWQGQQLETLVGHGYMPSTLDKHARELKLSGAAEVAREATAAFWMKREGLVGGVVAYIDASIKPVWTHHFTRSAKVSSTGRVMPAMSTVWLNSGSGTPLLYRTFSGHASVPREVVPFLQSVEAAAGSGTTKRLVVLDRESHAVWLFKELAASGWKYIVPLRTNVTGPNARFEEVTEWVPYGSSGDEVCDGKLWLKDSRPREPAMHHRVVGRRRHRTGKVAWYATNTEPGEHDSAGVIDLYFDRWPLQEHVFRDGNGRVGLDVHHGYGKKRVTNIAVVDALEDLAAQRAGVQTTLADATTKRTQLAAEHADWTEAEANLRAIHTTLAAEVDRLVAAQDTTHPDFAKRYADLRCNLQWLAEARDALATLEVKRSELAERISTLESRSVRIEAEQAKRAAQTTIFAVDTELDEIMTAYKLTFMNLASLLMNEHLDERMELDTLIRSVLTLPGERVTTKDTETIRIYRQPRDARAMEAVEKACRSLSALGLTRGPEKRRRSLRLELVDAPVAVGSR